MTSEPEPEPEPERVEPTTDRQQTDLIRVAIPLAVALIIGIFIALGIEGDVLSRLIRNSPLVVAAAFLIAILGLVVPIFFGTAGQRVSHIVGGVLVLAGATLAVLGGVAGIGEREQPDINVTLERPSKSDDSVNIGVETSALSLRSSDKMLVRVVAFTGDFPKSRLAPACGQGTVMGNPLKIDSTEIDAAVGERDTNEYRVLFWGESAPDMVGDVASTTSLTVSSDEFRILCVYAGLSKRGDSSPNKSRSTISLVDIRSAAILRE